ncbi:MAG: hypothetical protein V4628_03495 [Pseudomonadota bacterium]
MNSFFVELQNFETVLVSGPDSAKFLQGQLTCDVHSLADNAVTHGAACNNKGRIFASFILARHDADFHVLLPHGLAKIFIANLQKFIPFYKCSMKILSSLKSIGLSGPEVISTLEKLDLKIPAFHTGTNGADVWLYNLDQDNAQFILSVDDEKYPSVKSRIATDIPEAKSDQWELKNILSGRYPFGSEDVDKYTPQELHLDQTGYISFSKGCYTGQEIIARMHYRGKVKKKLYLLQIERFESLPDENTVEIFDDNGKSFGQPLKQIIDDHHTLFAIASLPVDLTSSSLLTKNGQTFSFRPLATIEA